MTILDWFKEVPLSAVHKEKLVGLENENATLKSENAALKILLEQCQEQRRALEKQITEEHNNPLTFDEKTGTWIGSVDGLRYCANCKSKNTSSPLKNENHGWSCPSCDKYFDDPNRPRPKTNRGTSVWRTA